MKHKAKKEIPHEELDKSSDSSSARYKKIGFRQEVEVKNSDGQVQNVPFILQDKVIYPINICPYCESEATFHRRIQENGDVVGNVWRAEQIGDPKGFIYRKFDYCLDCHREFLIELYIWKREGE